MNTKNAQAILYSLFTYGSGKQRFHAKRERKIEAGGEGTGGQLAIKKAARSAAPLMLPRT
jgi:hypothetical protein